jgi:hypothetical protein
MTNKHYPNSIYSLTAVFEGSTIVQYFRADQLEDLNADIALCISKGYNFTFKVL